MRQTGRAQRLLESLCELAVSYILLMQAVGLVNLAAGRPLFNAIGSLAVASVVIAGWWLLRRPRLSALPWVVPLRVPLLVLGSTYLIFFLDTLIAFPNGYDAVAYHLLKPISWLRPVAVPLTDTIWQMALPANGELFTLPVIAVNAQNLVAWGSILASGILALSVYLLGRRLSGSREGGVLSCIVALSVPIIVFQTFTAYVDVFGTAFLCASVALLLEFQETGRIQTYLLSVLCAGVSIGTKQIFFPYAALVLLFTLAATVKRKRFGLIPVLILASLVPSVLWISRNWVSTGNPFYPFPVRAGSFVLRGARNFPPKAQPSVSNLLTRPIEGSPVSEHFGLGAPFAAFGVAGVLAMLLETRRARRPEMFVFMAVFICVGAFWWIEVHIFRFGLPLIAAISIFCALLCARFSPRQFAAAKALLTLCVAFSCFVCLTVPVNRLINRIRAGDWSRAAYYGYPNLLDRLPPGASVLDRSKGDHFGFVLSGRDLQNRVFNLEGPLTSAALLQPRFEFAVKDGNPDVEDRMLDTCCDLVYDGTPVTIFPKTPARWRIYRSRTAPRQ